MDNGSLKALEPLLYGYREFWCQRCVYRTSSSTSFLSHPFRYRTHSFCLALTAPERGARFQYVEKIFLDELLPLEAYGSDVVGTIKDGGTFLRHLMNESRGEAKVLGLAASSRMQPRCSPAGSRVRM